MLNFRQNPEKMLKKLTKQPQLEMYKTVLLNLINPEHELCQLAKKINWEQLEKDLEPNYSRIGRPSVPIRTIVGALAFEGNPFDGHTLKPQIEQVKELTGIAPRYAIVDRGYKGQNQIGRTKVVMPKNLKRESRYLKKKRIINTLMAAGAYNMKKWMAKRKAEIFILIRFLFFSTPIGVCVNTTTSRVRKNGY